MASKQKKDDDIKIVAFLEVAWPGGSTQLRKFDRAQMTAQAAVIEHGLPVKISLLGFVRKDDPKDNSLVIKA